MLGRSNGVCAMRDHIDTPICFVSPFLLPSSYSHRSHQKNKMKAAVLNPPLSLSNPSPTAFPTRHASRPIRSPSHISFSTNPATSAASISTSSSPKPIVVVGSANADIYVEVDRLPLEGETISARSGRTLPGGKGANQAFCSGRLSRSGHATYLVGRVGSDAHGRLLEDSLGEGNAVCLDRLTRAESVPTGHAVVMLQPNGQNSIIIVGGANMNGWDDKLNKEDLKVVRGAGMLLLQREIPDQVNLQVAQVNLTYPCYHVQSG